MEIIDIEKPIKVSYCIPIWLRDEQIRMNTKRVKGRIKPAYDFIDEPIAVVNFGPSLNQTFEKVKDFRYVITCSGAHKFLLDKGFKPEDFVKWRQLEVDPREHKIKLLGEPRKGIEYLPASTCHPKYFQHLEKYGVDVKMWHVFSHSEESLRVLPPGEWALLGGQSVGLRAVTMARFLGFRDLHIFGMDGNFQDTGHTHASEHPNAPPKFYTTIYKGKEYKTTPSMLSVALETFHELDEMPDTKVEFYGEGLVQDMFKNYERKPAGTGAVGFSKPEIMSKEYLELNKLMHEERASYGVGGLEIVHTVLKLAESMQTTRILDFGCGKGYLQKNIDFPLWQYDPCVPGKDDPPRPADLVVCSHVLEHVEPEYLNGVLIELARVTLRFGYFVIDTTPAQKTLPDGRNTHLIQQGADWWREKLQHHFVLAPNSIMQRANVLHIIVAPKEKPKQKYNAISTVFTNSKPVFTNSKPEKST